MKRRKKFSVVYTYVDEQGIKRQRWETFDTNAEAKKRKAQVEYEQESGTFIVPSAKAVADLLSEYMNIYGVNTWAISTYEGKRSLISNYILPMIGDMKLDDISPRVMDQFYRNLLSVKSVSRNNRKPNTEYLTPKTVRSIHKLLSNAFNQSVYLPRTVAEMLLERRAYIDDLKELFGDEFTDYNLVFCTTNGRPIEGNAINKSFQNLIKANDLP